MSSLFKQIHKSAIDQDRLATLVLENTRELFEGFSVSSMKLICESASDYIATVIQQLQQKKLQNADQVVSMIAGLRVLGSAENREAFNIKLPTFKVLALNAGKTDNVNATLVKLGNNPSVKTIKGQIQQLISAATQGDEKAINQAVQNLNSLRQGYERVQAKLSEQPAQAANQPNQPQNSSTPTAKPVQNQATNQQPQQKTQQQTNQQAAASA